MIHKVSLAIDRRRALEAELGPGKTLVRLNHDGAAQPDFVQADTYDYQCPPLHL
jgi:hypothetical protein